MNHLKNLFNIFLVIVFSAVITACTGTPTPVNLAVKITGKGSIASASNTINCKSMSGDCSENYTAITDETFTATADPGYYFSGWTAYKCAGVDTLCKLTISSALSDAANGLYTLQAEFKPTDSGLKNVTYTYNAMGQRNSKTVGGITTYFIYDLQGRVLAELDAQGKTVRDNIYLGPEQIATFSGGQSTYIFNDHLATPVLAVDASGHPVWTIETDPFGATKKIYRATDIAARFPGQYADEETGFNYNYFRDYDPLSGRYIESDPIGLDGGINTYAYANGNPLFYSDPYGLWGIADIPLPPQEVQDFSAGLGDALLFDLGDDLRDLVGIGGINKCSKSYRSGELTGTGIGLATGGAGLAKAGLRIERGNWKQAGQWVAEKGQKKLHFHYGTGPGLTKHHLPYQMQNWLRNFRSNFGRGQAGNDIANSVAAGYGAGVAASGALGDNDCTCQQ